MNNPTPNGLKVWMNSFHKRHGGSPYEVLNAMSNPSEAATTEAWAAFYLKREAHDKLFSA